jgi:putative glutamine amidotransferase
MKTIGITDTFNEDKFDQYVRWIRETDPELGVRRLSYVDGTAPNMSGLSGLLLTGGGDVHPRFYDRVDLTTVAKGTDERRDQFEFDAISHALESDLPILGVCRGMQVMNVALGGSLYGDLPTEGFKDHSSALPATTMHPVGIVPHSLMHILTGIPDISVNSFHHQGVDRMGRGLIRTAVSSDGVTEAAEWALKDGMPFLFLVQWHPERMHDTVSKKIVKIFLREAHRYSKVQTSH